METAEQTAKHYYDGTHRVVDPETTLQRVMPFAAHMGITRVAVLTGLDTIGIPVAAAYRPNSRSIAVHQGKGSSLAAAKVSAVMEAVESFHAENLNLSLRLASPVELARHGAVVDPNHLPRAGGRDPITERLLWAEARDLVSDKPCFVPHELVSADFTAPLPPGAGVFQATTNGLASGNHPLEAILHGLYEVVERDAIALWHAASPAIQDDRAVDPASVSGAVSRQLLACFVQAGVAVRIWDITTDVALPAFLCLAASADATESAEPQLGAGCHADRDIALARALSEAAQARLTVISGARDDIGDLGYRPGERARRQDAARHWMRASPRRRFEAAPTCAGPTLRHDLDTALDRLSTAGLRQVLWVNLSQPDIGIPVARVIIPGMEGPWTPPDGEYTQGARAAAAADR
jgi:YcaO-like protein with predicted kinase domain